MSLASTPARLERWHNIKLFWSPTEICSRIHYQVNQSPLDTWSLYDHAMVAAQFGPDTLVQTVEGSVSVLKRTSTRSGISRFRHEVATR
jgi:hypothetical protein